jgi:hypothetical protein
MGKKKSKKSPIVLEISSEPMQIDSTRWSLAGHSYDEFVRMSAESILEAMHIASATGSIDGMLNASVQWGALAEFIHDKKEGRPTFGFGPHGDNDGKDA